MSRTVLKPNRFQVIFIIGTITGLTIALLTSFTTLVRFDEEIIGLKKADYIQTNTAIYRYHLLSFCYDHNIHPCDEMTVNEWNENHPDTTFQIQTPYQLKNEANRLSY